MSSQTISYPLCTQFADPYHTFVSNSQVKPHGMRTSYHTDGTGRDTYIGLNNGGLYKAYNPVPAPPVTSFVSKKQPYSSPAPRMSAKMLHYHSDGFGRDSYIGCNEGGLAHQPSFVSTTESFKKSLRAQPKNR